MKHVVIFFVLLELTSCEKKCPCPPTSFEENSGITPSQLADTVAQILAALRPEMEKNNILFSKAELSISAKQSTTVKSEGTLEGAFLIQVKLQSEMSSESETSVQLSYDLKEPVDAIVEIVGLPIINLHDKNDALKSLMEKLNNAKTLKKEIDNADPEKIRSLVTLKKAAVDSTQNRIKRHYIHPNIKNTFVIAIIGAMAEYKKIEKQFSETCFHVAISFAITKQTGNTVQLGFKGVEVAGGSIGGSISESVSISKEGIHTLKLTFGKC